MDLRKCPGVVHVPAFMLESSIALPSLNPAISGFFSAGAGRSMLHDFPLARPCAPVVKSGPPDTKVNCAGSNF